MSTRQIFALLILALGGILLANSAFVVKETDQVMVVQLGKVKRLIAEPGLNFRTPFVQQLIYFDKRILETDSASEEIQTKEKERVLVDSFSRWRIADAKKFYEAVRTQERARERLDTIVNSSLRRVLAKHTFADLISEDRATLMHEILSTSSKEAIPLGIELVDVRIKRADLPAELSRKISNRMRTEREKEAKEIRAKGDEEAQKIRADAERQRTIMLAEAQRDAQKLRGEGDAESIKIAAEAFGKDAEFFEFKRSLEAYVSSLTDGETMMILDPSLDFFKYFKNSK